MLNVAFDNSALEDPDLHLESTITAGKPKNQHKFKDIIGQSDKMQEVFRLIEKVADSDSTVIINGETGTGKGLAARAIHWYSYRKSKPFVSINCGAIPENLLESELFGHVRGAFTGATTTRRGKFEIADGGTIFLDEIGDMSPDLQVKLLRVLEEREFEQVGGCKTIKVDVRIIAATHRNLEEEVQKGTFRQDLFYRLYVIPIKLPPLRKRKSDIPILITHFVDEIGRDKNKELDGVSDSAMKVMMQYSWPGNVRELRNMIERFVVLGEDGDELSTRNLPDKLTNFNDGNVSVAQVEISQDGICLNTAVNEFEKTLIVQSLKKTKWVKNRAAKLLHLKRTTLVEKIKRQTAPVAQDLEVEKTDSDENLDSNEKKDKE